jgi:hypothetical protein
MGVSWLKQTKLFRLAICGLRIPYYYIVLRGHISKKRGISVDRNGDYIPWITYPAIDFLDNINLSECNVFEYGSGSSSLWWSARAKQVTSVEMDGRWYEKVLKLAPNNMRIVHVEHGGLYPQAINRYNQEFDVVIIDGAERYKCAQAALTKLSERGILILDNTEWYPNAAKSIRECGFMQVDFYGFPPGNSFPSITSIFFRNPEILLNRWSMTKVPAGGKALKGGALDDS